VLNIPHRPPSVIMRRLAAAPNGPPTMPHATRPGVVRNFHEVPPAAGAKTA